MNGWMQWIQIAVFIESFFLIHRHPQSTKAASSLTEAEWLASPCPGLIVLTMLDELWMQPLENCPSPRKNSLIIRIVSSGPPNEFTAT